MEWNEIKECAAERVVTRNLGEAYAKRLQVELKEVEKQGANSFWVRQINENITYETNKNGLVLPFVMGLTPVDPMLANHKFELQTDWPDIDIDCLPSARDPIKNYIAQKYGDEYVCSVGTWLTYKFRLAMQDVVRAVNGDTRAVIALTTELPDSVDDLKDGGIAPCVDCGTKHSEAKCPKCGSEQIDGITIGKLLQDYPILAEYNALHPDHVDIALRMVGKVKALGTHAGGVIISSIPLFGNIPMARSNGRWTSMWTEGRNTQLSKFGFVKWDVLGLKTLQYIYDCCTMIYKTRGIKFDATPWARYDRYQNKLGLYTLPDGSEEEIRMDDKEVFDMLNDLRTETVFQFETDVQRGILSNGVRDYYDLQVFNAMGHPGPMEMIPEYVKRRDDKERLWKADEQEDISNELLETHGIVVYQEQLASIWRKFADFTAPEAEAARKAVAKKWKEKLKPVREQWIKGASRTIGKEWAEKWWDRMADFARYAFNRSHSCAYIMIAYFTAWLKIHFAPEWWASVMSTCHPDKLIKYMNIARSEGVSFGDINVENITALFTVDPGTLVITPGLTSIKGLGDSAVSKLKPTGTYKDVDDYILQNATDADGNVINAANKTVMQRLILLGSFTRYHPNILATWKWYLYKHNRDKDTVKEVYDKLTVEWTPDKIEEEKQRQISEYKKLYPKRNKIPPKILNWSPKKDFQPTRDEVMALYVDDYTVRERLNLEKEYLGYYWHSPMSLYKHAAENSIKNAKEEGGGWIDVFVEKLWKGTTKKDKPYGKITVTDGLNSATVLIWEDELKQCEQFLTVDTGVRLTVSYDGKRGIFALSRCYPGGKKSVQILPLSNSTELI